MSDNQTLSSRTAEEIRVLLVRRRTSARKLAAQIGLSQSAMSARLTGHTPIDLNELQQIAAALDVPIVDLLPRQEVSRKSNFASLTSPQPATVATRTAEARPGHATPTLTDPPSRTTIRPADRQPATTDRNRRPVRLSTVSTSGEAR